jgi:hypothetical protein
METLEDSCVSFVGYDVLLTEFQRDVAFTTQSAFVRPNGVRVYFVQLQITLRCA